jgi:tRNA threonylcarbamoyladenosine biosynthesis protein TsaB
MIILTLRSDKPEAEIGLFKDEEQISYKTWTAHRQLAATLHRQIATMLDEQKLTIKDIKAVVCYQGPGSFTGLRIGLSVANALAYSLAIPIVGKENENWLDGGLQAVLMGENSVQVIPTYGAPVHITEPKK